jgi:hypothetical protein
MRSAPLEKSAVLVIFSRSHTFGGGAERDVSPLPAPAARIIAITQVRSLI